MKSLRHLLNCMGTYLDVNYGVTFFEFRALNADHFRNWLASKHGASADWVDDWSDDYIDIVVESFGKSCRSSEDEYNWSIFSSMVRPFISEIKQLDCDGLNAWFYCLICDYLMDDSVPESEFNYVVNKFKG